MEEDGTRMTRIARIFTDIRKGASPGKHLYPWVSASSVLSVFHDKNDLFSLKE